MFILYALVILTAGHYGYGAREVPAAQCQAALQADLATYSARPDFVSAQLACVPEGIVA